MGVSNIVARSAHNRELEKQIERDRRREASKHAHS